MSLYQNNAPLLVDVTDETVSLIDFPLVSCFPAPLGDVLPTLKKKEIVAYLMQAGIEPPKLLKADLIKWCETNATILTDIMPPKVMVFPDATFQKARRSVHNYLGQKFNEQSE